MVLVKFMVMGFAKVGLGGDTKPGSLLGDAAPTGEMGRRGESPWVRAAKNAPRLKRRKMGRGTFVNDVRVEGVGLRSLDGVLARGGAPPYY